jgi:fructokinase
MLRIGIDLGGSKIELVALEASGRVLLRRRRPTPKGDYQATLRAIGEMVAAAESDLARMASVGIGIPGAESLSDGRIKNANSTWLIGQTLRLDLEALLRREVRLANDANCFALSEAVDGAGRGAEVVFGVILGTGVGGGVVVHRRVLAGANRIAGEWGHNPLPLPRRGKSAAGTLLLRAQRLCRNLAVRAGTQRRPLASWRAVAECRGDREQGRGGRRGVRGGAWAL